MGVFYIGDREGRGGVFRYHPPSHCTSPMTCTFQVTCPTMLKLDDNETSTL